MYKSLMESLHKGPVTQRTCVYHGVIMARPWMKEAGSNSTGQCQCTNVRPMDSDSKPRSIECVHNRYVISNTTTLNTIHEIYEKLSYIWYDFEWHAFSIEICEFWVKLYQFSADQKDVMAWRCFLHYRPLWRICQSQVNIPHRGLVMQSFGVFFSNDYVISLQ